jgi:hypothetical protein
MNRTIRTLTLGLTAAAAALIATPAFAQKASGGATQVIEVEKPARTAVHVWYQCAATQCNTPYQVPAGWRLVVESVVGRFSSASSLEPTMYIQTELDGVLNNAMELENTSRVVNGVWLYDRFAHSIRFYSDSAPDITTNVQLAGSTSNVHLVGYLVKK